MTPTADLARFAAGLRADGLDGATRHAARRHAIDTLGAIIAGASQETTAIVARVVLRAGDVPVPGRATPTDLFTAAYLGGVAGHGLELDDGYRAGSFHPGVVVLPAVLALGWHVDAPGERVLAAIVAGYEVGCRIAAAMHPRSRRRGFHNTSAAGVFASAAACGVLLGLDATAMEAAFGIAGSSAAGLFSFLAGGDVKRLHPGHAAREGLQAALLAREGLPAPRGILEMKDGFFQAFAGGLEDVPEDIRTAGGGPAFAISDCYLKPHACCRHLHSAIDGVLAIMSAEELAAADVARVEIGTYAVAAEHASVGWADMTTAQMSFPFAIAAALSRGRAQLADFGADARSDDVLLSETAKVSVSIDASCDADYPRLRSARTRLVTTDGRTFEHVVADPYGAASNPLTDALVEAKVRTLVAPVLGHAATETALAEAWSLDRLASVRSLIAGTVAAGPPPTPPREADRAVMATAAARAPAA